jgi:hypothetical protein
MFKASVSKYGGCLQVCGFLMMIPGLLCLLAAGLTFFLLFFSPEPIVGWLGTLILLFIGAPSLAIGLFFGQSKKIWRCGGCGSFVERM